MALNDGIDQSLIPRLSTFLDASASRTVMYAITPGDPYAPDPIDRVDWYDPLDMKINKMFNNIQRVGSYPYQGEPITTISFRCTGSTTNWWIILQYNGFLHQDEIPRGTMLTIPDFATIKALARQSDTNRRRLVTF